MSNNQASRSVEHYTSVGAGGLYELLGPAKGAGSLRGTEDQMVYRDTQRGQLYRRLQGDFAERMALVACQEQVRIEVPVDLLERWLAVGRGDAGVDSGALIAETRALLGLS